MKIKPDSVLGGPESGNSEKVTVREKVKVGRAAETQTRCQKVNWGNK